MKPVKPHNRWEMLVGTRNSVWKNPPHRTGLVACALPSACADSAHGRREWHDASKGVSILTRLAVLASLLSLTACTTKFELPSLESMSREVAGYQVPYLPEPGKAMVYVLRTSTNGVHSAHVHLDDKSPGAKVGENVEARKYIYFSVTPGEHRIYSKWAALLIDHWAEINVKVAPGDVVFIQQAAPGDVFFIQSMDGTGEPEKFRYQLFRLDAFQGKFLVKQYTLGALSTRGQ